MRHSTELILHCNSHFTLNGRCYLPTVEQLEKMRSRRHTYCKKTTTTTKSDNIERQQFCQCVFRLLYICLLCVCVPPSLCFIDFLFILLLSFRFSCASFVASVLSYSTHCCLLDCVAVVFNALYRRECLTCTSHWAHAHRTLWKDAQFV